MAECSIVEQWPLYNLKSITMQSFPSLHTGHRVHNMDPSLCYSECIAAVNLGSLCQCLCKDYVQFLIGGGSSKKKKGGLHDEDKNTTESK
jgi:hypothetical protein